jgi:para-aminobenzoate synthetase component 1
MAGSLLAVGSLTRMHAGQLGRASAERSPDLDGLAPLDVAEAFRDLPGLVLLESARPGRRSRWSYLTADPLQVLEEPSDGTDPFAAARALIARLEPRARRDGPPETGVPPFGGGLAGYLSYDLGRRLETLPTLAADDQPLPLLRLGLYDWVIAWDRLRSAAWLTVRVVDDDGSRAASRRSEVIDRLAGLLDGGRSTTTSSESVSPPSSFRSNIDAAGFRMLVEAVRDRIGRGEIYQANIARRLEASFVGEPWPIQRRLRTGDPVGFAGYIDLGRDAEGRPRALLSAAPEPFLHLDREGVVSSDPIKGTRPRGRTPEEDRALAAELLASEKDRAENTMIVDVLRNDLGRVCVPGSVRVPRLHRLERTGAVQHLVSTISGRLSPGRDAFDLLAASFPGGSITGAPKIRAMELIEELEPVRRGPYTGCALWIDAGGEMGSSILIRTLVADGRRLTLHVGGGITWRSDPRAEWEETRAKARGPLAAIGAVEAEA